MEESLSLIEESLSFIEDVISDLEEKLKDEPYQVNLLEEVHLHDEGEEEVSSNVKENAHSRILRSLLSFPNEGRYIILESLLQYIVKKAGQESQWNTITIKSLEKPVNEKGRIDLLIYEKNQYALIFENKINKAGDQPNQIARYIDFIKKDLGYRNDQIFIIYLSSEGDDPTDQTWKNDTVDYKIPFKDRYINLSYKYDILSWLKKIVMPMIQRLPKEKLLESALTQYISYLEIKYMQRPIDMKATECIIEKLRLNDLSSDKEKLLSVWRKSDELLQIKGYLDNVRNLLLKKLYPGLSLVEPKVYSKIRANNIDYAYIFKAEEEEYYAVVYRYGGGQILCCGIFPPRESQLPSFLITEFKKQLPGLKGNVDRLYYDTRVSQDTINKLLSVANQIALK